MIGSPSDITDEIGVACEVLNHWNTLHSEQNKMVLLPLHWSFSSYPSMERKPQKSIDKQLVEKSDLMVCIFGTRLGSPTDTEISGTVEEIKEHRKAGKDVMVFFKMSVDDISSVNPQQLQKIKEFKESTKNDVLGMEFSEAKDYEKKFADALQLYINDNWNNNCIEESDIEVRKIIQFSDDENEALKNWTNSRNANCYTSGVIGGVYYVFGDNRFFAKYGKEEVAFDDFIERLNNADFIDLENMIRMANQFIN